MKPLRWAALFASCAFVADAPAVEPLFSFQGFYLGMSRTQATAVMPERRWQDEEFPLFGVVTLKEFPAVHLGRPATVQVQLDDQAKLVNSIAFIYRAFSPQECPARASEAVEQLRRAHGRESHTVEPGVWLEWAAATGLRTVWVQSCTAANSRYVVSYE
jgi:hypothetical protein